MRKAFLWLIWKTLGISPADTTTWNTMSYNETEILIIFKMLPKWQFNSCYVINTWQRFREHWLPALYTRYLTRRGFPCRPLVVGTKFGERVWITFIKERIHCINLSPIYHRMQWSLSALTFCLAWCSSHFLWATLGLIKKPTRGNQMKIWKCASAINSASIHKVAHIMLRKGTRMLTNAHKMLT